MAKNPKTRGGDRYTESAFFSFIRSALRAKFMRWGPRYDCLNAAKVPYNGSDKRTKFLYVCAICGGEFKQKEVEVDHHPHECGSLKTFADLPRFVENLFCEVDNLRCLCKLCHKEHTKNSREERKNESK